MNGEAEVGANLECIEGRGWSKLGMKWEAGLKRTGNVLGVGGWSELGMYWEAGVGANWECIGRRGWSELGMNWEVGV